jgi:hypothetical protein
MRLGFIFERMSNAYYRAIFPMRALERRGHEVVWPAKDRDAPMSELATCDLVHCYRRRDRIGDLRALSASGVAVSFDNDDNYALSDLSDVGVGFEGRQRNRKIFQEILKASRLADLTTTPSDQLARYYRAAGAGNVVVIENYLARNMIGFGAKSRHDGVVVGWIAGREHAPDLRLIPVTDALRRLLEIHPDVRVLSVGVALPLRSERYTHIKDVDFTELLTLTSTMDIGIAPLADTPFNRCRSNSKLKEYASGGAAWLASPVGPYRELGEGEGGMHVADDGWLTALDALVRSRRTRRRLAKRALRWANAQTIDRNVHLWEAALLDAVARAGRRERRPAG